MDDLLHRDDCGGAMQWTHGLHAPGFNPWIPYSDLVISRSAFILHAALHRVTDAHIAKLNDPSTVALMVNEGILGEALYRSLRVLDVDEIGRELCDCDEREAWLSINPYMSLEDWEADNGPIVFLLNDDADDDGGLDEFGNDPN
jgi:hypothetical protein